MYLSLQLLTLLILFLWKMYWYITRAQSVKEKPQTVLRSSLVSYRMVSKMVIYLLGLLLIVQLLGLPLFTFPKSLGVSLVGFVLVILGVAISVAARKKLGSNWAPSYEYQVKEKQKLVTTGIYQYIRHPIYTGILFFLTGAELVVSSYLWILFVGLFLGAYVQGKKEEKLLESYFGDAYRQYKKKTKMLIPFLF